MNTLPPNSQDTAASHGLTSALLTSASLAKIDKTQLLGSYLRSQSTYRSHFVQEGRKAQLKWGQDDRENKTEVTRNVEGESVEVAGFSTPKLKARVPEPPKARAKVKSRQPVDSSDVANSARDQRSEIPNMTVPIASRSESQPAMENEGPPKEKSKKKNRDAGVVRPRSPNKLDKYLSKSTQSKTQKTKRKRERSRDSGSERERSM